MIRFLYIYILALLVNSCSHCCDEYTSNAEHDDIKLSSTLSNQQILCLTQDKNGYIWFGTFRGLNRYNGHEMHQYFCNDKTNSLPDDQIRALCSDHQGRLWVATKNGIAIYNDKDEFDHIQINSDNPMCTNIVENSRGEIFAIQAFQVLKYDSIQNEFNIVIHNVETTSYIFNSVHIDTEDKLWIVNPRNAQCFSTTTYQLIETIEMKDEFITSSNIINNQLWLATSSGIRIFNTLTHRWEETPHVLMSDARFRQASIIYINCVTPSQFLFCTDDGLFAYDAVNNTIEHQTESNFPFAAPEFNVQMAYCDSQNNLWLCSALQGFAVRTRDRRLFNSDSNLRSVFNGKPISTVFYGDNKLWIAPHQNGLFSYDIINKKIEKYDLSGLSSIFNKEHLRIIYLFIDSNGHIWLSCAPGGVLELKLNNNKLNLIRRYDISYGLVIDEDKYGTTWIGCYNNTFYSKRADDNHFQAHHIIGNEFSYMSCLKNFKNGKFGVLIKDQGLRYINSKTLDLGPKVIPDSMLAICIKRSVFLPTSILEDHNNNIYIGTVSNGLLFYDTHRNILTTVKGTPSNNICSLEEDNQGNIWISTQYGLAKYNPEKQTIINYYASDGIGGNEFYDRASCRLPDGTLIFGGAHGLTVFNPESFNSYPKTQLFLEDLKVYNRIVRPGNEDGIDHILSKADNITLQHTQNSFSISFSALDFNGDDRFCYQYCLDKFNKGWIDAYNTREAFYANLDPGDYTFRVRATTKDQTYVISEKSIEIHILPAPWATWWAKLIYAFVSTAIIFFISRLYVRLQFEHWTRLESEKAREHEKYLNQMNMSFFANVSHEFRTPLTIISGPVSQLVNDSSLEYRHHNLLVIVQRSVNRMLRLVNQMMDFHKLEDDALRLEVRRMDIITLLRQSIELFQLQANEKKISISTHGLEDNYFMWLDMDKIDKIICNLLGNAIKYTQQGGHIDLIFDVVSKANIENEYPEMNQSPSNLFVKISIQDNGEGIPHNELTHIFERYYQINRHNNGQFNWGTGIGLYYTKRLVMLHHGFICVANRNDTQGSIFTFILPACDNAYSEDEKNTAPLSQESLYPIIDNEPDANQSGYSGHNEKQYTLMLIDDDVEIVHYVKTLLSANYNITGRFDAETALESIRENAPDLILCDVMMSGMSGYDFCKVVKNDLQLCHIPVILVTAKTTTSDQIEGLGSGADAYVTKPFDPQYLMALVTSILQNREKVRHILSKSTQTDQIEENTLSPQDNAFMTEIYKIMEQELTNPDLDVMHMTELLHISRTKLYYKVKGLTGENPSVFFKRYKLNRAAELIKEGKYNMSEIADMVGFCSLSHFSTSFKKQFGVTPSEYC